jgi:hypothetical protein
LPWERPKPSDALHHRPQAVRPRREARVDHRQPRGSERKPLSPALRANPFPEVTDPFCRLPLSTLFYRLEAVHLGDLMRLWVRPGKIDSLPRIFKGRRRRTGHRAECGAVPASEPSLRMTRFQGGRAVKKKRELFPGPTPASSGSLTLPSGALSR